MDIINLILSNMYGPGDHFEAERSHALGALIMKFVEAKRNNEPYVSVWGTGKPVREWLHIDDGAEAMIRALFINKHIEPINVRIGKGISILEMVDIIKSIIGYDGEIRLDPTKPDGVVFKTVDGSRGESILAWKPKINFEQGIKDTIDWYLKHK